MNNHINFYANPSSGNRVVQCGPMEGRSDMTKLITATILITSVLSHIKKAISHNSEGRYKRNAPQHIQLHSYRILRNSNQQIHSKGSPRPARNIRSDSESSAAYFVVDWNVHGDKWESPHLREKIALTSAKLQRFIHCRYLHGFCRCRRE